MAFSIRCQACDSVFSLDEELFERCVAGKAARFKCPSCGKAVPVDGSGASLPKIDKASAVSGRALNAGDLLADENEIAEISDEEVASLPPESLAAQQRRPPPRPRLESKIDDELWVVSIKEGVEDQEIFESSLMHMVQTGKVPADAIVWREGMKDWLPLGDVPELARHLPPPDDKTGGFLGTGMKATFGSNAGERKSTPPPLPPKKRSYGSGKKKSHHGETRTKPVALSPGFLFSVDDAESEPPVKPVEPHASAKAVPHPPLKGPRRAVTRDLDFSDIADDEEIPVSGTPALKDLTSALHPKAGSAPGALFASLSGDEDQVLGPPSIDISDFSGQKSKASRDVVPSQGQRAPESGARSRTNSREADESAADSPQGEAGQSAPGAAKKRKSKHPGARSSKPPRARASERPSAERRASRSPKTRTHASGPEASESEKGHGWLTPVRLVVLLAIAGLAYWLFSYQLRQPRASSEPTPETRAPAAQAEPVQRNPAPAPEKVAPPPEAPQPADEEEAEPSAADSQASGQSAKSAPAGHSQAVAQSPHAEAEPPAPPPKEKAKPPKQASTSSTAPKAAPTVANPDAPPFNKAAAIAALNTAVAQASGCRQEGDPTGTARVVITFAPSGRVTTANLSGPPFAGTRTGGCIASTMRRASVPPFSGSHVTVAKSVVIR